MEVTKILIVEDDPVLNEQLTDLLVEQGHSVSSCFDGEEGLTLASTQPYHLVLLDVMLPSRDGFSLLGVLRKMSQIPVIMLTAKGAEEERIKGLSHGADDYLTKPFSSAELVLRIDAILRRSRPNKALEEKYSIELDDLSVDKSEQVACVAGLALDLTPIQFKLLWTLILHRGEILSKAYLYQVVLNRNCGAHDRSLDMHVSRVRRKLISAGWRGERLVASHKQGYCLS